MGTKLIKCCRTKHSLSEIEAIYKRVKRLYVAMTQQQVVCFANSPDQNLNNPIDAAVWFSRTTKPAKPTDDTTKPAKHTDDMEKEAKKTE